jgi:predicted RNA-binding Zn-ribbon protein involved in translation (DUF1610 family)
MSDVERIWREKSDEDLLEAAAELSDYTEAGQQAIRQELRRRGLEDPLEQASDAEAAGVEMPGEDEEAFAPECTRCHVEMRLRGTRTLVGTGGRVFENADTVDMFACPQCGHVELFVTEPDEGE